MKISYKWLSDYIDIPYSEIELSDKLTMAGIEVEDIEKPGAIPDGIIVGEILERNPHPKADKLSVCTVSNGKEELQVVCGAPNCNPGVKTALATIGTIFKDNQGEFKIKKSNLRGVKSFGMMCSAKELGLEGGHDGIVEFSSDKETGIPVTDFIKTDTIYEVEVTPNRPDWLSHWGVARDLVALTDENLKFPKFEKPVASQNDATYAKNISVENKDLCPRYTARVIRGIKVEDSPKWMQDKLIAIGLRPINNIVDITNFVLHELGQPLHAFDLAKLANETIIVRNAQPAEKFITLDGKEIELAERHLVIADAEKPVALAGVMGGENSGVTETTVDILVESAMFAAANIRSTSRELHISSDSSFRFERGTDYKMCETASDRAVQLILELAGGELVTELIDIKQYEYQSHSVEANYKSITKLIGTDISNEEILSIFEKLSFKITDKTDEGCVVTPPSFRLDIHREADLVEEVARIYGLDKLPIEIVRAVSGGPLTKDSYAKLEAARNQLIGLGLFECMNYSMVEKKVGLVDARFAEDDIVKLKNPLSLDMEIMRPSLLGNMQETVNRNISRGNHNLALFEIGNVFCGNRELFKEERLEAVIAVTGAKQPERFSDERKVEYDFYDLKGLLESWMEKRRIKSFSFKKTDNANFAKGVCAELIVNNKPIAVFGKAAKSFTKGMRNKSDLYIAIIQISPLLKVKEKSVLFEQISQFPSTTRDVAFVADSSIEHSNVVEFIRKSKVKNLESITLFDIFEDDSLGDNKISMAYSMTFRHAERTLTDKEVNKSYEQIRKNLESGLNIELR